MKSRLSLPYDTLLIRKKNLLAFSAGIDSSALFFLLIEHDIPFDIAIVDYGIREESKEETAHAEALAQRYGLRCHSIEAPRFASNFEAQARAFRYDFFETLIRKHAYDNLLTAHQLNDKLEWFLMRLCKGAGLQELIGMDPVTPMEGYTLVRPLLAYTKTQLLDYLHAHDYPYFVDSSNAQQHYERNRFRSAFSDPLIARYGEGIRRSFDYLQEDKRRLEADYETLVSLKSLRILKLHTPLAKSKAADTTFKRLGYLLSAAQRKEIAEKNDLVVGRKWAVAFADGLLYIAPYLRTVMPKPFKEACRTARIPPKIRPYLFQEEIMPETLRETLETKR